MDTKTREHFRVRLLAQQEELLSAHGEHERDLRESHASADTAGPDRAAERDEAAVESRILESEELLLEKVRHALSRIEQGSYGKCEACGVEIPRARLDAKPSVSLCVNCQEQKEERSS